MPTFELVVCLLLLGVVLALVANRVGLPYPALLALGGAGLALVPGTPEIALDPELALALFVAPVLLDAAFDASPRDLRANLLPVSVLAVVVVCMTIAVVAVVAHTLVSGMQWPAAIALGAIVAPPDASAATAVLRRLRPPHSLVVILEGESLFNDATALLVYRVAVGAAVTGTFSGWSVVPLLLLTCGGGVVLGVVLARAVFALASRIEDIPTSVLTQFLSTFAVWVLADRLHLSAIVTVVAYAMTLSRVAPGITGAHSRIASYAVWDVAVFVLNVLAFILIGLQLRDVAARLQRAGDGHQYLIAAAAVCVAVVSVRFVFWMGFNWLLRARRLMPNVTVGGGLVIAWCGMRGIVTLAAALALPHGEGSAAFPQRDFIVLAAFAVVLSTLVVQGLSLRALMSRVVLVHEDSVDREVQLARIETARAALAVLDANATDPAAQLLVREYSARARAEPAAETQTSTLAELQRAAVKAQRERLVQLRSQALIGDDAFHVAENEIDLLELSADGRVAPE